MKALEVNVAEEILQDDEKEFRCIDKLTEKLVSSFKRLRERMNFTREGWSKKEKADFKKFQKEFAFLSIDVHQN